MFLSWLTEAAKKTGYPVVEVAGWQKRTVRSDGFPKQPEALICHHTATSASLPGDYPSKNVVTFGRSGLPGPLSNYGLGRSGTIYVIAAGVCNHAGTGFWEGASGNSQTIGIEAESDGKSWTDSQIDSYIKLSAQICLKMGWTAKRVAGHKEYALPKGRKPDPSGISSLGSVFDMNTFRSKVSSLLVPTAPPIQDNSHTENIKTQYLLNALIVTGVATTGAWDDQSVKALAEVGTYFESVGIPYPFVRWRNEGASLRSYLAGRLVEGLPKRTIGRGDVGGDIVGWKKFLRATYTSEGLLVVDGVFDDATRNATIKWQKANQLTADGIVGSSSVKKAGEHLSKLI